MNTVRLIPARNERGTALIVAMAIVMVLAGLGAVLMNEIRTRSFRTEVHSEDIKSFEAAEAGLDAALRSLNTFGNGCLGLGWTDVNSDGEITAQEQADGPSDGRYKPLKNDNDKYTLASVYQDGHSYDEYDASFIPPRGLAKADKTKVYDSSAPLGYIMKSWPRPQPQEFDFYKHAVTFGDVRYYTIAVSWETDGIDNDGNGLTDVNPLDPSDETYPYDPGERGWFTIYSTGFSNPATPEGKFTTVEAVGQRLIFQNSLQLDAALELQIGEYKP